MNATVTRLTMRGLLGRRRATLLVLLPLILIGLAVMVRAFSGTDEGAAAHLLGGFALGTLVPLMALIAGTGSIGPEIEDGSIVYLLSKPVPRLSIVLSKLAVATGTVFAFAAVPTLLAGLVLVEASNNIAIGYAVGAAVAGLAYCALFLLLAILTRNAVIVGLLYAIIWETSVAGLIPGAKALSIRQWSLSITERIIGSHAPAVGAESAVRLGVGVALLAVVTVGATGYAARRLATLRLVSDD